MRRSNFRLPLSDIHYDFASATSTVFDTIVVGGGVAGSMIAGKLLSERDKLLVIERGDNCLRPAKGYSDWVYSMPANMVVNRAINKQFVHRRPQKLANNDALQELVKLVQTNGFDSKNFVKNSDGAAVASDIQSPNVLGGGHIVLGGRSWFRGIESDWDRSSTTKTMPFDFDPRCIQLLRRLEEIPPPEENRMKYFSGWSDAQPTLRGKKGRFRLSRPTQFSEIFKPVLDGMVTAGCDLTSQWDADQPPKAVGAGRINTVMTDNLTSQGHSTLSAYLAAHLEVQNSVLDDYTVESLIADTKAKKSVAGVRVKDNQTGEVKEIQAKRLILAAGAEQSPKLLSTLRDSNIIDTSKVGHMKSMWTTPTIVLRYKINQPISLAPASNALVRALVVEEWRRFGTGWGCSAFDDMTCFYNVAPDLARGKFRKQLQQQQLQQQSKNADSTSSSSSSSSITADSNSDEFDADGFPKISPYSPHGADAASQYGLSVGEPIWLRINTQPFILNGDGNFHSDHGFQLRISLVRPFSRGGLTQQEQAPTGNGNGNGSSSAVGVDYRPLSDERDVEALKAGVDFVSKAIFNGFPPDRGLMASPFDAELVFDGPHGGGNLVNEVVDETEFRVKGLDNVFVSDSSTHPHGQCADSHLYVMMTTEAMHENALGRKLGSLD